MALKWFCPWLWPFLRFWPFEPLRVASEPDIENLSENNIFGAIFILVTFTTLFSKSLTINKSCGVM